MKKILAFLGAVSLTTSAATIVVSCSTPTRSPENVHILAETFNAAVLKAISDNPLEKPENGLFETTIIKNNVIKNMKEQKINLHKLGVYFIDKEINSSNEALNAFESITKFESAPLASQEDHQKYLKENNWFENDILIYLDSTFIKASLDNPERITVGIPRMIVVRNSEMNILINNNSSLTQQAIINIKS
ncbi:hypothetical protein SSABA_v1c03540 [Spiroplasma sabaudiense Ar-1343]|uniref:Lipoprotein n=1 Tax=Spiroplasma sabaudiense Ar-1343 TaxID=1276257 RepID=W6A9G4_9MOLU|nr:lipoprotein [Spiroplasma sabaudiense]AHI53763.1 hypothetical protein SSABA_v1c03540 [Spiroplasma sabaudiense Ar-1343]